MSKIDPFFTIDAEWRLGSATVYARDLPIGKVSLYEPGRYVFFNSFPGGPSRAFIGNSWLEAVALCFMWVGLPSFFEEDGAL